MSTAYLLNLLTIVCIHLIVVLGISVLTGFTRLFSFGNAGFMSIGAYTSALLTLRLGVPFWPAVLVGCLAAGIIAYFLGSITLKLKGDYFLIATLGFGECVRVLFSYIEPITGGAKGLAGIPKHTTFPVAFISALIVLVLTWTFIHSKYGRSLAAIREQEIAAEAVGIKTSGYKKLSFVYSAVLAGFAGGLYAHSLQYLSPDIFNLTRSSEYTITVVIGGLGSITGSVLGALLINLLPEMFRSLSSYRMLFYGVAVVAVIVLKPNGLCGYKEFSARKIFYWFKNLPGKLRKKRVEQKVKVSENAEKGDMQ